MPVYRDFEFKFTKNIFSDVNFVDDIAAIRQALKDILFTRKGERVWNPRYGSNIHSILFEKVNLISALRLKDEIQIAIENWEPRVKIIRIECFPKPDENLYEASIYYDVVNLSLQDELRLELKAMK